MGHVAVDEAVKVKSIFCFVIAPEMKRRGIATRLVERVCQDAAQDHFDLVEAYPQRQFVNDVDYTGPIEMYEKCGFSVAYGAGDRVVVRWRVKENERAEDEIRLN